MKKKNLWNRGLGLLVVLPLTFSLAACDSNSPSGRDHYEDDEEDEETPTPTKAVEETPTEEAPTQEPDNTSAAKPDYDAIYAPILEEVLEAVRDGYDFDKDYSYLSTGIMERCMYGDKNLLLNSIGYMIADISGDGVPELLIGEIGAYDEQDKNGSAYIYDAYTCADDKPVSVFEGWARNSQRWIGDGKFYNTGSNGAMYSSYGQFHLSADGTEQIWDDFYFTTDENGDIAYYHNNTGVTDPDVSEKLDVSVSEFMDTVEAFEVKPLTFMPIGYYKGTSSAQSGGNSSSSVASKADEPIVGSWNLRSYVNMSVRSYEIFEDGTWLAVESMPSYLIDGSLSELENLSGTWEEGNGGSAGYNAYNLLDENGDVFMPVLVYDEDGTMAMNTGGNVIFYYSDPYIDPEIVGTWLTEKGSGIEFDDKGNWNYYEDDGTWQFGGHCVVAGEPGGVYLRLHTQAGNSGNTVFAEGEFYMNNNGYNVIDMKFAPEFRDVIAEEASLSKSR